MKNDNRIIFEKGTGSMSKTAYTQKYGHAKKDTNELPDKLKRDQAPLLPEISELEVIRHFTRLAHKNFSIDTHMYPLGSCTMKYNPRFLETVATNSSFLNQHPMLAYTDQSLNSAQGSLELLYEFEKVLCEVCGMYAFTTQPMAGAHGEFAGILLIAEYHSSKGQQRSNIILPDSSHGTNPASAAVAGYDVITIPSLENGEVDLAQLKAKINSETAAIMLTCPNTHGLFETQIKEIAEVAHQHDALLYYDGANLNAILGKVRPGDLGFDVVHVNVHKTFATPHGGGGPGAGPVGVTARLEPFLPNPKIIKNDEHFYLDTYPQSIGKLAPFFGNFGVLVRSLAYIINLGRDGLLDVSQNAVLAANYVAGSLKDHFKLQFDRLCMHESVLTLTKEQQARGVKAIDIAKYLIDNGVHAPTVYFPLTVKEAMMIEPTETESKEELDNFIRLMVEAADLIETNPDDLLMRPVHLPVERPDETLAARQVDVRWKSETGV